MEVEKKKLEMDKKDQERREWLAEQQRQRQMETEMKRQEKERKIS